MPFSSSVIMWKPIGNARDSTLLMAVLDVDDPKLRTQILQTLLFRKIMARTETIGAWLVERLSEATKMQSVADYLVEASSVDGGSDELIECFAKLKKFTPAMLQLPAKVQEKVVVVSIVSQVSIYFSTTLGYGTTTTLY
jgi:hypothetical protein